MTTRDPTPCERAIAWAINVRVAAGVSSSLTGSGVPGGMAAIMAMLLADDRGIGNLGVLSGPVSLLLMPGNVTLDVLRRHEPPPPEVEKPPEENPRPCCAGCAAGTGCDGACAHGPA